MIYFAYRGTKGKSMFGFVWRVLAAGASLVVIQGLAFGVTTAAFGPSGVELPPGSLGWVLLSNLVTAVALTWLARRSTLSGAALVGLLALMLFSISTFNGMIEALFFHVFGPRDFARYVLQGALTALAVSVVVALLRGRARPPGAGPVPSAPGGGAAGARFWRLAGADLLYLACYLGAGTVIYPWVREFYQARDQPAQALVAAVQLFLRGPIYIALMLLLVRTVDGDRRDKAILAGATLSLLGGVAPLLIPNPYFPDTVRWAHFFEVGISNFVYGAAATWLLTPPPRPVAALAGSSA
jgi:hypothetical protein